MEVRARIVAAFASLKGKRGAPFSFITSGDRPSFGAKTWSEEPIQHDSQQQQSPEHPQLSPPSLKLSWLLRPLRANNRVQASDDRPAMVKMPSYLSSMTLSQTVTDPIEGGILTQPESTALFMHFMLEMNTKWEYVLDPHFDTHDGVRQRSRLLFATILFCSSKFARYSNGSVIPATDPFLQSRLCSLARSLAIKAFAEGDRSIETIQALYFLVCWKDVDDDVSYLHSGYAFRVLNDLDLERSDGDGGQAARRMRTWLALFRQDKQQNLFFMRRASLGLSDNDPPFIGDRDTWLKMRHALPLDFIAGCSADLRRLQSKLRVMVEKASSAVLPCLLELMDSELNRWRSTWKDHLQGEGRLHPNDDPSLDNRLLRPAKPHLRTLLGLWEHSVRLNVASAIFRQALAALVDSSIRSSEPPSSLGFDIRTMGDVLSPDAPGLASSVEGAFGTLRHLLEFPANDLRRAPDSVQLLGPNAALFLCLLLCLPCKGILGPSFQRTAVGLIQDTARHVRQTVKSPQDTVNLHSAYLESLVDLLAPGIPQYSSNMPGIVTSNFDPTQLHLDSDSLHVDQTALQAAHVLAGGMGVPQCNVDENEGIFSLANEPEQNIHMQSLANLLDTNCFWEIPPLAGGM